MITQTTPLILGSASPRRRDLLATIGIPLRVIVPAADEEVRIHEAPDEYLARIVADKLVSVAALLDARRFGAVLVADTVVIVDGLILGKPRDERDAAALVGQLVGREHEVSTRFAIATPEAPARISIARTVTTRVVMRAATSAQISRYAATGEGLDKAGGYAVQGIGSAFVERIDGSYPNVMGLPLCEVVIELRELRVLGVHP